MNYNNLRVDDNVRCNGYDGVVVRCLDWDKDQSLIEVRVPGGIVCVDSIEVTRI